MTFGLAVVFGACGGAGRAEPNEPAPETTPAPEAKADAKRPADEEWLLYDLNQDQGVRSLSILPNRDVKDLSAPQLHATAVAPVEKPAPIVQVGLSLFTTALTLENCEDLLFVADAVELRQPSQHSAHTISEEPLVYMEILSVVLERAQFEQLAAAASVEISACGKSAAFTEANRGRLREFARALAERHM